MGGKGSLLTRRADDEDGRLRPQDIAVMYRTNAQSRAIEEAFLRYGIRYQLVGGTRFYQRREVKDALAYLRILRSDTDQVSFERIINVPARAIGDKTIEVLRGRSRRVARVHRSGARSRRAAAGELELATRTRSALAEFADLVRRLRTRIGVLPLPELLDAVLEQSGYRAMLADGSEDGEDRWANLLELRAVTTRYDDLSPDDALDRLLEETALVADQDSYEGEKDAVTLITLHAAKGLEFAVVFIAGLEEGVFPHARALEDEQELEEERRLAYVGITRAKRRLFLRRVAARDVGQRPGVRAEPVPARDPGRADGRAEAAPRRRATGGRRRPLDLDLVFGAAGDPVRDDDPDGRRRVPAGERPPRRPGLAGPVPADPRPRRAARRLRLRRAFRDAPGAMPPAPPRQIRARPIVPGERQFRDGDRIHHGKWGKASS